MTLPLLPLTIARVPDGLRQALAQEGVPFVELPASGGRQPPDEWPEHAFNQGADAPRSLVSTRSPVSTRFVLFDSRIAPPPPLAEGQRAVDVDSIRRHAAGDGFARDVFADLVDERSACRAWRIGSLDAVEEVARVDKRAVRKTIVTFLRRELERLGGVWMTVSPYPHPHRSAFNFRFDHDEFVAADFDAVLAALRGWEDAASHYVCGSTHEGEPEALARLRGMDVGSHGYWHHTYVHAADNVRNIARGIDVLRAAGIEPSGFVAPHGRFNAGLLDALERLSVTHGSEFALAYDDVPFFPRESTVLQIPVHPVSLGIILEAARRRESGTDEAATRLERTIPAASDYFRAAVRAKYSAGEPIFFYCHPNGRLGRYPEVLRAVLEEIAGYANLWKTTYSQFARWWRARAGLVPRVEVVEGGYSVVVDHLPADFVPAVELWRGDRVVTLPLTALRTNVSPMALPYVVRRVDTPPACSHVIPAPRGWRTTVLRRLDWERVTPPHEIRVRSVHTLVKKTLRYIKR